MQNLKLVNFKAIAAKGAFVYCYLRKDGRPYYIGVATRHHRPTDPHTVKLPADIARIRVMRSGLSREQAIKYEKFYIARYGRLDIGTGILRNRTSGGDGGFGHKPTPETLEKMRVAMLGKNKTPRSAQQKKQISASLTGRKQSQETIDKRRAKLIGKVRTAEHIARYRDAGQASAAKRDWASLRAERFEVSAAKYGVTAAQWASFPQKVRAMLSQRYGRGKRGAELLAGITAA